MNGIIHINEAFVTEQAARDYKEHLLYNYNPMGYGTSLEVYPHTDKDSGARSWVVRGSRYAKC